MAEAAVKGAYPETSGRAWRRQARGGMKVGPSGALASALLAALFMFSGIAGAADPPRNADYFYERVISFKPTIHDIGEKIRIARGIDPDRMAEFSGIHEAISYPGDTDPDSDEFKDEAYGQLRAEIRMTYAELASTRSQADEVRRSLELLRQLVGISNTLYATGRIDQPQALRAQIEWERMSESLLTLEKREKVFSIRLNVLAGDAIGETIPCLEPLPEYTPAFNTGELAQAYKSRRFFAVFQQLISRDSQNFNPDDLHGSDSLDTESDAFISTSRVSLESLSLRLRRYRTALIPRAEQSHTARLEAYRTGKVDFPALLEGLMGLSEMRKEYQAMLGEIQVMKARLEYSTGVRLD